MVTVDEVNRVTGRVGGEHGGGEGARQRQRVAPLGQRGQPLAQGAQLRDRAQPHRRPGLGPAQVLGPLHRIDAQRKASVAVVSTARSS